MLRVLAILLLMSSPAAAECNRDLLNFFEWDIGPLERGLFGDYHTVTVRFRSNAEKPIRMLDAEFGYYDALDEWITGRDMDRDVFVEPGGVHEETHTIGEDSRLVVQRPEEVETYVCVDAVLYDDGSKQFFE